MLLIPMLMIPYEKNSFVKSFIKFLLKSLYKNDNTNVIDSLWKKAIRDFNVKINCNETTEILE